MDIGIVSSRYAKALFKFAAAHQQTDSVYEGIKVLRDSFLRVPRLKVALGDPMLSAEKQYRLLHVASGQTESKCLQEFFRLLIKNRRVAVMPFIVNSYIELYRIEKNIVQCRLTVPSQLGSATIDRLKAVVEKKTQKTVDFALNIDPAIIGGFIIEYDSQCLDASVAGQLRQLRKQIV
ncbi:MAG: F0F1 ATP synthase subunit delta [Bacteroidaceae bacterium]|nr:F0F1 ATP synthase subunit delta [Bacteroidaceae bacterium]